MEILADGKLHRCDAEGKSGKNDAAYLLHLNGIPAGGFENHRDGLGWENWRADTGRARYTPAEEAEHRAKVEAARKQRETEQASRHAEARESASLILAAAYPAPGDHPYLVKKTIQPNGAKVMQAEQARTIAPNLSPELSGLLLVIPMWADGVLHSLQFIGADTLKRPVTGSRVAGCYYPIGNPKGTAALAICEGFATGASIHEATGYPVAVAFSAGNLMAVAQAMRAKFPDLLLILCADDDYLTAGNPGLTKATEAARAVGSVVAVPDFGPDRPEKATDFNDMAQLCGLEAVGRAIANAASNENGVSGVSGVQPSNDAASTETPAGIQEVSEVSESPVSLIPGINERPRFCAFDAYLEHGGAKYRPGVWYFGIKPGKGDAPPALTQSWVCSPLHIEAITFDGQDNNFGRLLRFRNTLNRWREWAMPMELLKAGGDDLRGELLAMGVEIDPTAKTLLANYLQAKPPKRRMRCALQVGWCDGSFVLPDVVIGPAASGVIFQSGERGHDEHTKAGTLEGWQAEIAARAVGNPLLLLALSASFAGPLLARCNAEGGGIHYVGDSSTGKTTAIEAACATWGGPNFRRSWRATANGMEGAAALFNDCLLALDEISECDPKEVGAIVYALGNGRGKQRANRSGNARGVVRWRCVVLSSGERTIATTMLEVGHRAKAGQSVRLLDIPASRTFGAWDTLHGMASGTAFSDAIKRASATHHGHAGRAFLEQLTRDTRDFCALLERIKDLPPFAADGGEGQDKRAAGRFALFALAGEVATEYGLTGWPEGEAIRAAAEGFKVWRGLRGHGNDERRQILDRVSGFIERHGDGRFSDANSDHETQTRDRAGWWSDSAGERAYLFTADGMREALKGFDFSRALDALQEAGALPAPGAGGKRAKFYRIGGRPVKLYPINPDKLGGDHGA